MRKTILKLIGIVLTSLLFIFIGVFFFLYNQRIDVVITNELRADIKLLSESANILSEKVYKFFEVAHPNTLENSPNKLYFYHLTNQTSQSCGCEYLSRIMTPTSQSLDYGLNKLIISNFLFDNYGNKGCLNMYLHRFDFINGQIGIKNASNFYFNKTLTELTSKELATLIIMIKNPNLYNPLRFPVISNEEAELLIEKIKN